VGEAIHPRGIDDEGAGREETITEATKKAITEAVAAAQAALIRCRRIGGHAAWFVAYQMDGKSNIRSR